MSILQRILDAERSVNLRNNSFAPKEDVKPDDKVLGVMPDDLKVTYIAIYGQLRGELEARCEDLHPRGVEIVNNCRAADRKPSEEEMTFLRAHNSEHAELEFAVSYFWFRAHQAFPETTYPEQQNIGVRKDWKIVIPAPSGVMVVGLDELLASVLR